MKPERGDCDGSSAHPHGARARERRFPARGARRLQAGFAQFIGGQVLATQGILLFCLIVFGLCVAADHRLPISLLAGGNFSGRVLLRFGLLLPALVPSEPWRLLSAVFVHFDAIHIGMNMWGLVSLGRIIEQRFEWARTLVIFVVTGICGFAVSYYWSSVPTAGASGGIFGLLGALVGVLAARRRPGWKQLMGQNLVYALVLGFFLPVNNVAHFAGFGVGFALGFALDHERRRAFFDRLFAVLAIALACASVASVALCFFEKLPADERELDE